MRTRVKICGITRIEDGLAVAQAGADAIGLVFEPRSPRFVEVAQARAIARALPPFVTVVGLFVDADERRIRDVLGQVPLHLLQFHGNESPDQCRMYGRPYLKAISMKPDVDVRAQARAYADAAGLLLDTHHPLVSGGSGETFDWSRVPQDLGKPLVLAGGLTLQNVAAAMRAVRPYAVDVSSGVEQSKGIKDAAKIAAFIDAVWSAA